MKMPRLLFALASCLLLSQVSCGPKNGRERSCGDGLVQSGEDCDDGNNLNGDACPATCSFAVCGDGVAEPGEDCDDGNTEDGDACPATCLLPRCGDGMLRPGIELCDDGNAVNDDGCDNNCRPSSSGPTITDCPAAGAPALPSGATCEVTAGSAAKLLTGTVLIPGEVLRGGQVLIDAAGQIVCAACDCSGQLAGATEIVCPTGVISPGLINTHDHISFQSSPGTDSGERYEHRHDWRKGLRGHTAISSGGYASSNAIRWAELRHVMSGTTSTVGAGSGPGLLRNLDSATGQEGLGQGKVNSETFPLGDSNGTLLASSCAYPGIDTEQAVAAEPAYVAHVSEGVDAETRNEFLCTSSSLGGGHDLVQSNSGFVHGIALRPSDYAQMAIDGTALIWSPRSNVRLYGATAEVTTAARLGVQLALGTDWVLTGSMNLLRELRCADLLNQSYFDKYFTDEQLWRMVTIDAAAATATDDAVGTLAPGLVGDVAIFSSAHGEQHRAILNAEPADVVLVLRAGKALYGDATIVSGLSDALMCDPLDVCGVAKSACVQTELGMSYAELEASVSRYPTFFCQDPTNEPTCVPSRPAAVSGSTVYDGQLTTADSDGDGIPDSSDNCVKVFNPVRPLDGGQQADFDADGVGDPCDPCPLDANITNCPGVSPGDYDGDTIPNQSDNCPQTPNLDQLDSDGDLKGDACDQCPMAPNPGPAACTATIYQIKSGAVAPGDQVSVEDALVTGRNDSGFFLQVKETDPGYQGRDHSGVYVYASGNTVAVGDRVNLTTAAVANYYGQIQLGSATIQIVTSASETPPAPVTESAPGVPLLAADVATGGPRASALEGVLVQLSNVTVSDVAPAPGPGDSAPTGEFEVEGSLRVNDLLYAITPLPMLNENFTSLTGILELRNGNSKLEPRDAGDLASGPPRLVDLSPALAYVRVGVTDQPTIPVPLQVVLSRPSLVDLQVTVSSAEPTFLQVQSPVLIPAGSTAAPILATGLQRTGAFPVTVTAMMGADSKQAQVRVLDNTDLATLDSLSPAVATVRQGKTVTFTVSLDLPAEVAKDVTLSATGGMLSDPSVTIPVDAISATFTYTQDATPTVTVSATRGITKDATVTLQGSLVLNEVDFNQPTAPDTAEYVELYNPTAQSLPLTGLALVFVNGSSLPTTPASEYLRVPLTGSLAAGAFLVVGSSTVTVPGGVTKISWATAGGDKIQNGPRDGVGLLDTTTGELLDALSYEGSCSAATIKGLAGTYSFVEGTAMGGTPEGVNMTSSGSLGRKVDGVDSDDHSVDWSYQATPTPGAPNQP